MATKPHRDSHPICPTCESNLTGTEVLYRLAGEGDSPIANDDVYDFYEETVSLLRFLTALAQAGPLAVAQAMEEVRRTPDWLSDFERLTKEMAEETERRLGLLRAAGLTWQKRAEGKEG